jgi:hypothetical protein
VKRLKEKTKVGHQFLIKITKTPFLDNQEVNTRQIVNPLSPSNAYPNTSKAPVTLKLGGILIIAYLEVETQQVNCWSKEFTTQ